MTMCAFHQDAGSEYDELGERIAATAEEIAPLVAPVTGLALPDKPIVRLVTVKTLEEERRVKNAGLFQRERGRLPRGAEELKLMYEWLAARSEQLSQSWISSAAEAFEDEMGRVQLLAVADALHHTGAGDDYLRKMMAHELTHLAQHEASTGLVLDYAQSPIGRDIREGTLAFHQLVEGHASWADRAITKKLLGHEVGWTTHDEPTELGKKEIARIQDSQNDFKKYYDVAADFVRTVIEERGVDSFNKLWGNLILCPTTEEIHDPESYFLRTPEA